MLQVVTSMIEKAVSQLLVFTVKLYLLVVALEYSLEALKPKS
jgi:hypothetical protein